MYYPEIAVLSFLLPCYVNVFLLVDVIGRLGLMDIKSVSNHHGPPAVITGT